MRRFVKIVGCWFWFYVLSGIIAVSTPIPIFDVADLANKADLIAVGQIISVSQRSIQTVEVDGSRPQIRIMVGEMRVDQVLKGTIDGSQLRFEFALSDAPLGYQGVTTGSYRMVFFKKTPIDYSFVSPYYPSCQAIPDVPLREGGPVENIVNQLAAVVQSPGTEIKQKQEALYALRTLRTASATLGLRSALQQRSIDVQLVAAAALLERNDISAIQIAEAALTGRSPGTASYLLHNITYAISEGLRDGRAVPMLTRLLRVPEVETRRAAASALWHTGSPAAAPALAAALDDPDFEVRYFGVVGLAEITGQSHWHPNMDVFHTEESRYLEHWRNWAAANSFKEPTR